MSKRALLLDRDGVINIDKGYVGTIGQFEFLPGLFSFLHAMQDIGFYFAILTNQSGVARGYYTENDYQRLTKWMLNEFIKHDISINLVLASFEHPEGIVEPYCRDSYWRKPNPGMVIDAIQRLNIDPSCSIFLGDNIRDLQAARKGGIKVPLWLTNESIDAPDGITIVRNFDEALKASQSV